MGSSRGIDFGRLMPSFVGSDRLKNCTVQTHEQKEWEIKIDLGRHQLRCTALLETKLPSSPCVRHLIGTLPLSDL